MTADRGLPEANPAQTKPPKTAPQSAEDDDDKSPENDEEDAAESRAYGQERRDAAD